MRRRQPRRRAIADGRGRSPVEINTCPRQDPVAEAVGPAADAPGERAGRVRGAGIRVGRAMVRPAELAGAGRAPVGVRQSSAASLHPRSTSPVVCPGRRRSCRPRAPAPSGPGRTREGRGTRIARKLGPDRRPCRDQRDRDPGSEPGPPATPTVEAPPGDEHGQQRRNGVDDDDEQGVGVRSGVGRTRSPRTRGRTPRTDAPEHHSSAKSDRHSE